MVAAIGVDVAEPYEGEEKPPWTSTVKDQSGEPTLEWPTVQVDGLSYLSIATSLPLAA